MAVACEISDHLAQTMSCCLTPSTLYYLRDSCYYWGRRLESAQPFFSLSTQRINAALGEGGQPGFKACAHTPYWTHTPGACSTNCAWMFPTLDL